MKNVRIKRKGGININANKRRKITTLMPKKTFLSVPRFPGYFADQPLRKFCRLRYVSVDNLAGPTAATIRTIEFRANGMYDPDVRVGGHQPYGFDQIMLGYGKFTVVKASMTVENLNAIYGNNVSLVPAVYVESGAMGAAYAASGANGVCVRCRLPAMSFSWTVMQPTLLVIREVPLCGLILLRFLEKKLGILSEMIGSVEPHLQILLSRPILE